jgi:hypothetical protein
MVKGHRLRGTREEGGRRSQELKAMFPEEKSGTL